MEIGHGAGQVTGGTLEDGARGFSCRECCYRRLLFTGTGERAGMVTVVEWAAVFDLATDCFLFVKLVRFSRSKLFCIVASFRYILRVVPVEKF